MFAEHLFNYFQMLNLEVHFTTGSHRMRYISDRKTGIKYSTLTRFQKLWEIESWLSEPPLQNRNRTYHVRKVANRNRNKTSIATKVPIRNRNKSRRVWKVANRNRNMTSIATKVPFRNRNRRNHVFLVVKPKKKQQKYQVNASIGWICRLTHPFYWLLLWNIFSLL